VGKVFISVSKKFSRRAAEARSSSLLSEFVMAGLVPATHEHPFNREIMGPRDKPGDDDIESERRTLRLCGSA
jgi:hypothetical protein